MPEPAVVYRYVSTAGEFLHAIPARDLTEVDVAALTDEQREAVVASPLYAAPRTKAAREAVAARPEPAAREAVAARPEAGTPAISEGK